MPGVPHVHIRVREPRQLFNSMDPSPFHERDLDQDCERFIVDWARELPVDAPIGIDVHMEREHVDDATRELVSEGLRTHFAREAAARTARLRLTLREGRRALATGLAFLALCITLSNALARATESSLWATLAEGLVIAGWVAMWRPMEVFLYELGPLRRERRLLRRLAEARVELIGTASPHATVGATVAAGR